jgi:hypothetical protein
VRDVLTGSAGTDTFVISDEDVVTDNPSSRSLFDHERRIGSISPVGETPTNE